MTNNLRYLAKGMTHLYPAIMWIAALAGATGTSYFITENQIIIQKGAIALIAFSLLVLVGSYLIGRLLREEAE